MPPCGSCDFDRKTVSEGRSKYVNSSLVNYYITKNILGQKMLSGSNRTLKIMWIANAKSRNFDFYFTFTSNVCTNEEYQSKFLHPTPRMGYQFPCAK